MANSITKIQLRRDSSTNWSTNENVVLDIGEPAVELLYDATTGEQVLDAMGRPVVKMKIGDGVTAWKDLEYQTGDFSEVAAQVRVNTTDIANLKEEVEGNTETDGLMDRMSTVEEDVSTISTNLTDLTNQIFPATEADTLSNVVASNKAIVDGHTESIGRIQSNLENNYYTKEQTDELIGEIPGTTYEIVTTLPNPSSETLFNTSRKIYLLEVEGSQDNYYDEYITLSKEKTVSTPELTPEAVTKTQEGEYAITILNPTTKVFYVKYAWLDANGSTASNFEELWGFTQTIRADNQSNPNFLTVESTDITEDDKVLKIYYFATQPTSAVEYIPENLTELASINIEDWETQDFEFTVSLVETTETVYNWEKIGSTSVDLTNYVTTTDLSTALAGKQNTLTPGENITITNNVISASGEQGPQGETGNGIASITATKDTSVTPNVTNVKITETNGNETSFAISDGAAGGTPTLITSTNQTDKVDEYILTGTNESYIRQMLASFPEYNANTTHITKFKLPDRVFASYQKTNRLLVTDAGYYNVAGILVPVEGSAGLYAQITFPMEPSGKGYMKLLFGLHQTDADYLYVCWLHRDVSTPTTNNFSIYKLN